MKTSTKASLALPPSTAVDSARLSIFWLEKDIQHLLARGLATPPNQIRRGAIGISPPQSLSAREMQEQKSKRRRRGSASKVQMSKSKRRSTAGAVVKSREVFSNYGAANNVITLRSLPQASCPPSQKSNLTAANNAVTLQSLPQASCSLLLYVNFRKV